MQKSLIEILRSENVHHRMSEIEAGIKAKNFYVYEADENGKTAMHYAVQIPGLEPVVVMLVNNGFYHIEDIGNDPADLAYNEYLKKGLRAWAKHQSNRLKRMDDFIKDAIERESLLPISDELLDNKFPERILTLRDICHIEEKIDTKEPVHAQGNRARVHA